MQFECLDARTMGDQATHDVRTLNRAAMLSPLNVAPVEVISIFQRRYRHHDRLRKGSQGAGPSRAGSIPASGAVAVSGWNSEVA
jgi:hypothetical protein